MKQIRILLVDDEIDFSAPLGKRLARRGMDVHTASSGQNALTELDNRPVDVILLDIKMAGMDGLRTLSEIKRTHPQIAVIMLTAHADTDMVLASMGLGACGYLMKPVNIDELVDKVREASRNDT
ncbi:response regulator [Pseudodesulfovibrio nedwellii]|uniref:Response regulator n=1 Tax=Pseudodesulfovibrio nedwellii TaxID=2973072 RepID=A0ABM8B4T2_9BACT|nr:MULTISPECIES: response regulator [Pseudodesulfovibrio]BDQ38669.1 response regulator [Pseudodesulfovibrio nedwellii]